MKSAAVVRSLSDLGAAWNLVHANTRNQVRDVRREEEKPRKCRKCGGEMNRLPNTNVWVCGGMVEEDAPTPEDPKAKKMVKCGNTALSKR